MRYKYSKYWSLLVRQESRCVSRLGLARIALMHFAHLDAVDGGLSNLLWCTLTKLIEATLI